MPLRVRAANNDQEESLRVELFLLLGLPAMVFGAIGPTIRTRFGVTGLVFLGGASFVAVFIFAMVALPSADLQVHDFERSPLPGLAAAAAGPIAGVTVLIRRGQAQRWVATSVLAGMSFGAASTLAAVVTFLAVLGG